MIARVAQALLSTTYDTIVCR